MTTRRRIDLTHPRVLEILEVLLAAEGPLRQRDLALRVFPWSANASAMVATYLVPLLRGKRVRLVNRGLYEVIRPPVVWPGEKI